MKPKRYHPSHRGRRPPGYVIRAGIRYVYDLSRDEYVPVIDPVPGPTDIGEQDVARISEDLGGLAPDDLPRDVREGRYGGEVR